ncbi:uroporphyrinogen-III C-methyltransferase [Paludisphaera borealis]|uniref:uroporphyrinogen-III C-methyltransferase n=1 Tax=Paludisphaera borealis TaxID=1387353 RepID=A0A1U7CKT3_9BACT|nr:uroporphyrinogen-III C-methyltransferase [Paludisphaera borealis]APW59539.1 Uroporphyrinogen-III C-methyltransferase [Paludisphaera borealis]
MSRERGIVYLIGAGPGDPGLMTLRGADRLGRAEVVVFDHLASARLLDLAPASALRICAGKSVGHCTLDQNEINQTLVEHAQAGKVVVRLKGGDPLVFGRGSEEAAVLRRHGIPFEIVPGVTAGVGATAYAGIPVTCRGAASAVAFVTGHSDPEASAGRSGVDWPALARFPGTLVVYMGVTHLDAICRTLIREGKPSGTPAAIVESGSLPSQRVVAGTLESITSLARERHVRPPALLVVGEVVARRGELEWFESLPLFGQRIVVTRPRDEAARSASALEALGAEVVVAPTVEIRQIADSGPLDAAIDRLGDYDWLVFTSVNGVRSFLERLFERGKDLRALGGVKLAAIGPSTAEALDRFHLRADLIPPSFRSESLAESLAGVAAGSRILLARADRGRTILKDELSRLADVDQVAVYQNADADQLPDSLIDRIMDGSIDWITLSSSAITARLHALLPEPARRKIGREIKLASISPITTQAAANLGWTVAAEASTYTWDGLIEAMTRQVAAGRAPL